MDVVSRMFLTLRRLCVVRTLLLSADERKANSRRCRLMHLVETSKGVDWWTNGECAGGDEWCAYCTASVGDWLVAEAKRGWLVRLWEEGSDGAARDVKRRIRRKANLQILQYPCKLVRIK